MVTTPLLANTASDALGGTSGLGSALGDGMGEHGSEQSHLIESSGHCSGSEALPGSNAEHWIRDTTCNTSGTPH